jgi:hypothetical protein
VLPFRFLGFLWDKNKNQQQQNGTVERPHLRGLCDFISKGFLRSIFLFKTENTFRHGGYGVLRVLNKKIERRKPFEIKSQRPRKWGRSTVPFCCC